MCFVRGDERFVFQSVEQNIALFQRHVNYILRPVPAISAGLCQRPIHGDAIRKIVTLSGYFLGQRVYLSVDNPSLRFRMTHFTTLTASHLPSSGPLTPG